MRGVEGAAPYNRPTVGFAKTVGNVEGNRPYNRPTVGFAKTVGGGAFDAPAVTDLNIFHLPANTQDLTPSWSTFSKEIEQCNKRLSQRLMRQPLLF